MSLLSNGQYRIFNVQFPTQDADLLFASSSGVIGGYLNNSLSYNMWNLKKVGDQINQFTLTNAATSNQVYASAEQFAVGATLHGSTGGAVWSVVPTPHPDQYWILAPTAINSMVPSGLVWTLSNGDSLTPIQLAPIAPSNLTQMWTFHPQVETVGNVARGIDELD